MDGHQSSPRTATNATEPSGPASLPSSNSSRAFKQGSGTASPSNRPIKVPPPKPVRAVARNTNSPLLVSKRAKHGAGASQSHHHPTMQLSRDPSALSDLRHPSSVSPTTRRRILRKATHISCLNDDLLVYMFSFLSGENNFFFGAYQVSKYWHQIANRHDLYAPHGPLQKCPIAMVALKYYGLKNHGTEGFCFKVYHRGSGVLYAMKKARVYPKGEGVPYYMLRELAFLRGLQHPHIATLERIALVENELFVFFKYVEKTLFDLVNPTNNPDGGMPLPPLLTKRFLYQVLQGVAFCHQRGVLHRNLKPKHLLVDFGVSPNLCSVLNEHKFLSPMFDKSSAGYDEKQAHATLLQLASNASVKISDFALVRSTSIPLRNYTTEVVTLWYRAPEVLMGGQYFAAVDMWSVGCVFGEMVLGEPLFPGICEVDQLFQIFSRLGTPNEKTWSGFSKLPHYNFKFPNWKSRNLQSQFPTLEPCGVDLLSRLLTVDPSRRITADEALCHRYFDSLRELPGGAAPAAALPTESRAAGNGHQHVPPPPLQRRKTTTVMPGLDPLWDVTKTRSSNDFRDYSIRTDPGLADMAYLPNYYHYLKHLELELFPLKDYLVPNFQREGSSASTAAAAAQTDQAVVRDLQPTHRSMLVDWLVEVIDVFDMSLRSVFLAVNYTDRYLSREPIDRKKFQLLGATCLHIASKCEDVSYIGVEDLVVCADRVYVSEEVLQLEEKVLNVLDFRLAVPTVIDFLNAFIQRLEVIEEPVEGASVATETGEHETGEPPRMKITMVAIMLAKYVTELSLQERYFIACLPSKVAATALVLALAYRELPIHEKELIKITGYSLDEIEPLFNELRRVHFHAPDPGQLTVIRKRYQKAQNCFVANLPPLINVSIFKK